MIKQKLLALSVSIVIILGQITTVSYGEETETTEPQDETFSHYDTANLLSDIHIFVGSDKGYELGRSATRVEALVLLIRMLGKEDEALELSNQASVFSDTPQWAIGYVNYAYEHALTKGIGDGQFGANQEVTLQAFLTFMMRALGYSDTMGDFTYAQVVEFAMEKEVYTQDMADEIGDGPFLRNHLAQILFDTLTSPMAYGTQTLSAFLVEQGVIDQVFIRATAPRTPYEPADTSLSLLGPSDIPKSIVAAWARSKGMSKEGIALIDIYYDLSEQKNLNPVIQYVQMCYETGWLYKYTDEKSTLDASFHNPCGLKNPQNGGDYEASAYIRFDSWYEGIDAHTDHSALYAGVSGYPKANSPDPKQYRSLFGIGDTVQTMANSWASPTSPYADTIIRLYNEIVEQARLATE